MSLTEALCVSIVCPPRYPGDTHIKLSFEMMQIEGAYGYGDTDGSVENPLLLMGPIREALAAAGLGPVAAEQYDGKADIIYLVFRLKSADEWGARYRDASLAALRQLPEFAAGVEYIEAEAD